jgi:Domain of unknown function (DUF4388)
MSLSSSFNDFSLAELFQLIDQGKKSGCLTVRTLPELNCAESKSQHYYIWFNQGRVVAAANRLNGQCLVSKITQRNWANRVEIEENTTVASTPLGLSLKIQGVLSGEQLNLLFAGQIQQIRQLFEIQKGVFKFDSKINVPWREMTGLSLKAIEVVFMALRVLKNWEVLEDALPDKNSAIQSSPESKPQIPLSPLEWHVWEFAKGNVSLLGIANQLNQPIALIRQASFRLILAGLVEEVPLVKFSTEIEDSIDLSVMAFSDYGRQKRNEQPLQVSTAFLQNLVGFLRSKT